MSEDFSSVYSAAEADPLAQMEEKIEEFSKNQGQCDPETIQKIHSLTFTNFMGLTLEREDIEFLCEKARALIDENQSLHAKCLTLAGAMLKMEREKKLISLRR